VFVLCVLFFCVCVQAERPCDELITRPWSPTDSPRSNKWSETERFMEAAKAWIGLQSKRGKERCESVEWIELVKVMNTLMKLQFPLRVWAGFVNSYGNYLLFREYPTELAC
jgi:hypothetical protein